MPEYDRFHRECLLKEYELKFGYLAEQTRRVQRLISTHLVLVGGSLVAFFGTQENPLTRTTVAAMNIVLVVLAICWITHLGARVVEVDERVQEIARILGIHGYRERPGTGPARSTFALSAKIWLATIGVAFGCLLIQIALHLVGGGD